MAVFTYRVTDGGGRTVEGRMEAQDADAVAARLQELNFYPLGISLTSEGEEESSFSLQPLLVKKGRLLIHFTHQVALLLEAGLPLDRTLGIVGDLVDDARLRSVVKRVQRSVEEGNSFADALARHPRYFSDLYVSMVRAGEASGTLDKILLRLAEFLEEWQRLRDIVVTALTYPAFLTVFAAGAVLAILTIVVPRFALVFADMGRDLPGPTRMIMTVSQVLTGNWWVFLAAAAATAAAAFGFFRSPRGKRWWDRRSLSLPIVGSLVVKSQVSRFARVLGTLVNGGVPILRALEIVTGTLTNSVFSRSVSRVQSGLKEGQGIAEPLRRAGVFPPLFLHMVTVGEETGKLEEMLLAIAATYDRDFERGTKRLLSLFEPIIILFMGVIIGTIVLSILYGIFSINQIIS